LWFTKLGIKEKVLSIRLTKNQIDSLNDIANEGKIKTGKLMENITNDYINIFYKCFNKRHDLVIQRNEIKELYNRFEKDELDEWIEKKYPETVSCMQLFVPVFGFEKMSDTLMEWFKLNNHYLYYEDVDGWRTWKCISDMGYNWLYVNGKIYQKMFESIDCKITDFKTESDGFEFKVEIPK